MQLARAVTPLAADGVPLEDRLPVTVLGPFHVVELVRVTEQASGFDESLEMDVVFLVAGGQVPLPLPGIPGDRRLEEVAVSALQQERHGLLARADDVAGLGLVPGDDASAGLPLDFGVKDPISPPLDRVLQALGLEQGRRQGILTRDRHRADITERPAHRMPAIRLGDLRMATHAGGVPHVLHAGADVPIR